MLRIIWFYLKLSAKADRLSGDQQALAGWSLFRKKSFRSPAQQSFASFRVIKHWARAVKRLFSIAPQGVVIPEGNPVYATWDNRPDVQQIRVDHIKQNGGEVPGLFISRNVLSSAGIPEAIWVTFLFTFFLPYLFAWALFSKHSSNIVLLFDEWIEAHRFMRITAKYKTKYVYFFCPYENDANALFLLLKKNGITVNKIPSPNLLAVHNTEMLTDTITLTSPYQLDELTEFVSTIRYSDVALWVPEQFHQYADVYRKRSEPQKLTIGYYSHGSWIRQKSDTTGDALGDISAELSLVTVLGDFLSRHNAFTCTVFLHPKEKKHTDKNAVAAYYDAKFGVGRYVIADLSKPGSTLFDTVDIGIGAISTILFERLFMGCKTIFYPKGFSVFPLKTTAIASICPVTPEAMESLILQSAGITTSEYLEQLGLRKYTIYDWNPALKYEEHN
ncbi:MAG TPA: hypothetical protein VK826_05140 [Bacteroidia bacterium]|nr:hypothetical protein [Bacteroidia bacterium]